MRWLLLVLLISLMGLLFAALGLARFIWKQRYWRTPKSSAEAKGAAGQAKENDAETEL
jgi:hypothetical protein